MALWSALCMVVVGAVEVVVEPLSTVPFEPQTATVRLVSKGAQAVDATVELVLKPPASGPYRCLGRAKVPAGGDATVRLRYEVFEAGRYPVTVTAKAGTEELGRYTGELVVAPTDGVPWLFPNYYRQSLTRVERGQATTDSAAAPGLVVPRPRDASAVCEVGADNRLRVAGRPWFPLGIYLTPGSAKVGQELAEAGFDLVCLNRLPAASVRRVLDSLASWQLKAWMPIGDLLSFHSGDPAQHQRDLRELVAAVGDHPGLVIWESVDEPLWGSTPAWGLDAGYRFLRALDPRRPIWTNHAPRNTVQSLAWYNRATDITGCDIYPVPPGNGHSDLPNRGLSVTGDETAKQIAGVHGEKPIFMVLQGFAWRALDRRDDPQAVYPTFAQSRFMAYDAIVAGANGLLYWGVPYSPRPSRFWSDLKSVVSELRALMPAIEGLPVTGERAARLEPAAGPVRLSHRRVGERDVLLLVNRSEQPQTVRVLTAAAGPWRGLFGDADPTPAGEAMALTLAPLGVAVVTNDPNLKPARHDYTAEAAAVRPLAPMLREAGNALPNPSFEQDQNATGLPDGWELRYPFSGGRDTTVHRNGEAALRLASEGPGYFPLAIANGVSVKPDQRYRLSGWVRTTTPGVKARIYCEWVTEGQFHGGVLPWMTPGESWQQVSVEFTTAHNPQGSLYTVAQVQGTGTVWFDDLSLMEIAAR